MGLIGDQSLSFAQNKTLAESDTNGVSVYLFEVHEEGKYLYHGQVHLVGKPYQENQPDQNDQPRKVWMFRVQLVDNSPPAPLDEEIFIKNQESYERKAARLSMDELRQKIKVTTKNSGTREIISKQPDRNPYVAEYVKRRANGICELCSKPAPFLNKHKKPYLEEHHIVWLSKGGSDTVDNTVALCPNCHRRMHVLDHAEDRKLLLSKTSM